MIGWTDERVARLRILWDSGLSASRCAAELGGTSRNAVIGKLHRLRISERAKGEISRPKRSTKAVAPKKARVAPGTKSVARAPTEVVQKIEPVFPVCAKPDFEADLPVSGRVPLFDLKASSCRWPFGDPGAPDFGFCGASRAALVESRPYCAEHEQLAYAPAPERSKKKTASSPVRNALRLNFKAEWAA